MKIVRFILLFAGILNTETIQADKNPLDPSGAVTDPAGKSAAVKNFQSNIPKKAIAHCMVTKQLIVRLAKAIGDRKEITIIPTVSEFSHTGRGGATFLQLNAVSLMWEGQCGLVSSYGYTCINFHHLIDDSMKSGTDKQNYEAICGLVDSGQSDKTKNLLRIMGGTLNSIYKAYAENKADYLYLYKGPITGTPDTQSAMDPKNYYTIKKIDGKLIIIN